MGVYDAYLKSVQSFLDSLEAKGDYAEDPETKARYIRTPEGAAKYGGKIGDLITDDMTPGGHVSRTSVRRAVSVAKRSNTPTTVKPARKKTVAVKKPSSSDRDALVDEYARMGRHSDPEKNRRLAKAAVSGHETAMKYVHDDSEPAAKRSAISHMQNVLEFPDRHPKKMVDDARAALEKEGLLKPDRSVPFDEAMGYGEFAAGSHKLPRSAASEFSYMKESSSNGDKYTFEGGVVSWDGEEGRTALLKDLDNWIDILDDHVQNETGAEKARQRRLKQAFEAFYESLQLNSGKKWDDIDIETKDALGALVDAGTHEWVEDPDYDGVEALVEAGTMKALVVVYRDGTCDLDDRAIESKTRYVRDPEYWGVPYMTPITPGMKPKGTGPKG